MIYKTECISFPRSGHHGLKMVLADYFGDELVYCDNYVDDPSLRLGTHADTNYCKEHDLNLDLPIDDRFRYLIQVRDPLYAIPSWIEFDSRVGAVRHTETREEWFKVYQERTVFWQKWVEKWILSNIWPRLVIPYDTLVTNPFSTCESVIQFMTGEHPDPKKLKRSLERFPLTPRPRRISPFMDSV